MAGAVTLKPAASGGYRAYWANGGLLGDVYREVDGYYVWWPTSNGGFYTEHVIGDMTETLKQLNKEWDEEVRKACVGPSTTVVGRNYTPSKDDSTAPF